MPLFRDLFDSIFWYDFDPYKSMSAEDRIMFGRTRGKFHGLDMLMEFRGEGGERMGVRG